MLNAPVKIWSNAERTNACVLDSLRVGPSTRLRHVLLSSSRIRRRVSAIRHNKTLPVTLACNVAVSIQGTVFGRGIWGDLGRFTLDFVVFLKGLVPGFRCRRFDAKACPVSVLLTFSRSCRYMPSVPLLAVSKSVTIKESGCILRNLFLLVTDSHHPRPIVYSM